MGAPKKNQYWTFREKHGRDHKYTPEGLWKEAIEYFQWVKDNPLKEQKLFAFKGVITKSNVNKIRAMTIIAFCLFADICHLTWANYKKNKDFIAIITRINDVIYSQKFEGAAADLLNPNIIARDLGLKDKSEVTTIDEKEDLSKYSYEELKELAKGDNKASE